ncbi:MAG: flagellar hook-basal body complex protein [Trichlorobacter sp.]|uniref:flagellar hook-basal body protein n=1 Tax=Trichlorobacter sp. TaxID=2911007 RepID=UPI002565CD09|nr:flagellar hook-basal body complex protein [Trichlorobacter sp.]MDK9719342.1 flagellar hook-basal body complex protein [Trichlorobacter sp.]
MSITSAMYSGVSGLLANAEGINVIGNNLANVNTVGFKSGRMLFSDMLSASGPNNSQIGRGVQIQKVDNIYAQGAFENTEVVSDVAIQGNSFFAFAAPNTTAAIATQDLAYLSRAGALRVNSAYNLVNPDGYVALEAATGAPIDFLYVNGQTAGDFAKITAIDAQGVITYSDYNGDAYYYNGSGAGLPATTANYTVVRDAGHTIAVVNPTNPLGLIKVGGTLFKSSAEAGVPTTAFSAAVNRANGSSEKMYSNSLEQSNVDMAAQFVKMILTQRAYSANSKTITTADEMTQEVLNLKR